jgi:hypothetical protein
MFASYLRRRGKDSFHLCFSCATRIDAITTTTKSPFFVNELLFSPTRRAFSRALSSSSSSSSPRFSERRRRQRFASSASSRAASSKKESPEEVERRKKAEELASESVQKWSSPLFAHVSVDVETHKNRQFTRAENALFAMAVLCVFGYFGNFAMKSSRKKEEAKRALREKREKRALKELHRRMSLRGRDDEDGFGEREEEEDEEEEEEDPFEGLTPEEIVQLKEKVENEYQERRRRRRKEP